MTPCQNDMIHTLVANYLIQSPPSNSSTTEVNSDISTDTSSSFNTEQSNESEKVIHKEVRNICICTKCLRFDFIKCLIMCSWHKKTKLWIYESCFDESKVLQIVFFSSNKVSKTSKTVFHWKNHVTKRYKLSWSDSLWSR